MSMCRSRGGHIPFIEILLCFTYLDILMNETGDELEEMGTQMSSL